MQNPSKTVQLGVIVLAYRFLRQHDALPLPKSISEAAKHLEVSRQAGYEAAKVVLRQLNEEEDGESEPDRLSRLERDLTLLSIRNQVLTFERDHPGVRFADRSQHLPEDGKILCVRILRDFQERLGEAAIAAALAVPASSLRRWNQEVDDHLRFPEKPDGRGKSRHHREEDEQRVLALWKTLDEETTLVEFSARYRREHPDRPLDPKTIGRILQRHGLAPLEAKERGRPYHDKVEIFFPGAQAATDATECQVSFAREGAPTETVTLKEQVALDIASGTILGTALREEEDAEGVKRVVVRAREECESILAVLSDNGSANTSGAVKRVTEEETELGSIFTFPAHPRTNGHIEGFFGQFNRIVGSIAIDDSSRESIARSVLTLVWAIYTHFHNYSPRKRLGGLAPIEYLRRYAPSPEEVEGARSGLRKRKERSAALRRPNPRLRDEAFRLLVESLIADHGFDVELEKALEQLVAFDTDVIERSSRALTVASCRDGFDENKRTFAYFMGIVQNKQREADEARLRREVERDRTRFGLGRGRIHDQRVAVERAQDVEELRQRPEGVILEKAALLLAGEFRYLRESLLDHLRRALGSLERLGRNTPHAIDTLALEIRGWGEFREELKDQMIERLRKEARTARERAPPPRDPSGGPTPLEPATRR